MSQEDKKIIENYIDEKASCVIGITKNDIEKLKLQFLNSEKTLEKVKEEIDVQMNYLNNKNLDLFLKNDMFTEEEKTEVEDTLNIPLFDYHTHTKRCGHAGNYDENEYIEEAKKCGIKKLGFSDHIANYPLKYSELRSRMSYSQMDEYIKAIYKLKENNSDIDIYCGFEAEFDPKIISYLCDLRDKVDYMILGQHYVDNVSSVNNPNYPLEYANMVVKAIESGIFDIVGHPDVYMSKRDSIVNDEDLKLFDENSILANKMIINKAIEYNIPLELNLAAVSRDKIINNGTFAYPNVDFWNMVIEKNARVILARDSHSPEMFEKTPELVQKIKEFINYDSLYFVDENYNPKINRENNEMLNKSYLLSKEIKESYEALLTKEMLIKGLSKVDENESFENIINKAMKLNLGAKKFCEEEANRRINNIYEQKQVIKNRQDLSKKEKERILLLLTDEINDINNCLLMQNEYLTILCAVIKDVRSFKSLTKDQTINIIKDYIELSVTDDPSKKELLGIKLESKKEKAISNTMTMSLDEIQDENINVNPSNEGKINILGLVLLLEAVLTLGVTIATLALKYLVK